LYVIRTRLCAGLRTLLLSCYITVADTRAKIRTRLSLTLLRSTLECSRDLVRKSGTKGETVAVYRSLNSHRSAAFPSSVPLQAVSVMADGSRRSPSNPLRVKRSVRCYPFLVSFQVMLHPARYIWSVWIYCGCTASAFIDPIC
jgi:hypothetical protein